MYTRIWVCRYWHMQLPESFKIARERPCCSQRENPDLKKCLISVQSYVYNEMITLFPMKVPVKKYSDVDWIRQAKNTELTFSSFSACWWSRHSFFIFLVSCRCKRRTHWVSECITACVCVCVRIYIDMVFRDNIVQAANMFSITNARYFKRNCEFNVLFFESGLDGVWGKWI
jgi:hypothetical protein